MTAAIAVGVALAAPPIAQATPPAAAPAPALLPVIVTLAPGADPAALAARAVGLAGGRVGHVYSHALNGFSASLPQAALSGLLNDKRIVAIEPDGVMRASGTQSPTPSWGLDRIDQRARSLNNSYTYNSSGAGVAAYIIDTGIQLAHPAFGGRALSGFDAIDGGAAEDCNGHGTHVAGTVGSAAYGVAKAVRLYAVRVLDCQGSGSNSQVIAGIDWVVGAHAAGKPAVANLSLGGSASKAIDDAVRRMVTDGVSVSVAAGNDNTDACKQSPSRVAQAITVGAATTEDARASFSNVGSCVDLFAPGVNITSAWLNGGANTISGTSMATPHVAGVAAQYLETHPAATPATVAGAVGAASTKDVVTGTAGGCTFLFLFCTPATPNNDMLFTSF